MRYVLVFLFAGFISQLDAQENYLNSPYSSVRTHLHFLQDETYNDSLARLPFMPFVETRSKALDYAIRLKQILDGKGIYIDIDDVPKASNYYDSAEDRHKYVLTENFPEIFLVRQGNQWVYSKRSLEEINSVHGELFAYGTDRLLVLLPKFGTRKIMGLHMYQYVALFILILTAVVLQRILAFLSNKILLRVLKKAGYIELAKGFYFLLPDLSVC